MEKGRNLDFTNQYAKESRTNVTPNQRFYDMSSVQSENNNNSQTNQHHKTKWVNCSAISGKLATVPPPPNIKRIIPAMTAAAIARGKRLRTTSFMVASCV